MEAYLLKSLRKIKSVAPKKLRDIRTLCDEHIEILTKNLESSTPRPLTNDADRYWDVFELCCICDQPRVVEAALHSVHYLIEHRFLRGSKRVDAMDGSVERRTLMDEIIRVVCGCSEAQDDGVELQVVKVLLTAVTSAHCEVHEGSLLAAVKACFHVHLTSHDQNNKLAAKASLTQMLSLVFQRMERFDEQSKKEMEEYLEYVNTHTPELSQRPAAGPTACGQHMYPATFVALGYTPAGDHPLPLTFSQDSSPDNASRAFPSILHKDAFLVFRALCKLSRNSGIQDDAETSSDQAALRSKILALELLLHILEHAGPAFRTGEKFVHVIRSILCVSLLENCTSNVQEVVGLSLRVFVALVQHFKVHLKSEIEVFVTNIFLKVLESEYSTFDHKMRVLEVFDLMCQDPNALGEFFVNYDCDFDAIDLYRAIVAALSRIAKGKINQDPSLVTKKSLQEDLATQQKALEGLNHTIESLITLAGLNAAADPTSPVVQNGRAAQANGNGRLDGAATDVESTVQTSEAGEKLDDNSSVQDSSVYDGDTLELASVQLQQQEAEAKEDKPKSVKDSFTRKQKIQEEVELGILKFNLSPKKGLAYLANLGHVETTPKSVAKFLHQYRDKLDKTIIGDYISKEREYDNGFCVKVLHEYVDMMDFTDMEFDGALRVFLSGFRLPGEAQKIDRVMEKFAERYCSQNKAVFPSADMAFILAFSTIMLQTDLHNPAIREDRKITKEGFIRNNKGISSEGDLPDEFLAAIYDRIAANPISLKEDEELRNRMTRREDSSIFATLGMDRKKKEAYSRERQDIVRTGEALFRQKSSLQTTFVQTRYIDNEDVQAMFEIAWPPMTSVFSQVLELSDEEPLVNLCLEGCRLGVKMAARLNMKTARDTFVNSLVKFTTLDTVREMKPKNIQCIKLLLTIAVDEGSYLNESWGPVLECISQIARLQLLAHGLHTDDMFFSTQATTTAAAVGGGNAANKRRSINNPMRRERRTAKSTTTAQDPITKLLNPPSKAEIARGIEERNAELLIEEIDQVTIDRIFARSAQLSSDAIQHFVAQLCEVSKAEVTNGSTIANFRGRDLAGDMSHPRVFSLQKLVEVADYNMTSRPRIVWANIWRDLARHFSTVGIHENSALAMYAIDSLRQLSIKFLYKDELRDFSFQRFFLKPFEVIMSTSRSAEIKELVLRCLDNMILARAANIRSGWKSIFAVYSIAAADENRTIAQLAFDTVQRLLLQSFDLLVFDFVEIVNCLVAFVAGPHVPLSLEALKYLKLCADQLVAGAINPALDRLPNPWADGAKPLPSSDQSLYEDTSVFKLWWPLLLGLAGRVSDSRYDVRLQALEVLKGVLQDHGSQFSQQAWEVIFKGILFPILDNAKTDRCPQVYSSFPAQAPRAISDEMARSSWIISTAPAALSCITSLYFSNESLLQNMLGDLMTLLEGCICQEVESLARIALRALNDLVLNLDSAMPAASWDVVVDKLVSCTTRCLTVKFSNVGQIRWDEYVREDLLEMIHGRTRGRSVELVAAPASVRTTYGRGKIVEEDDDGRLVVALGWGAVLHTNRDQVTFEDGLESDDEGLFENPDRDWETTKKAAMTGVICAMGLVKLLSTVFQKHLTILSEAHLSHLSKALELCYQYSRCFNHDPALRVVLHSHGFMQFPNQPLKLPHLLELETQALAELFMCLFRRYRESAAPEVAATLRRLLSLSTFDYVSVDNSMDRTSPESDARVFATQYLQVYSPVVQTALEALLTFTTEQFRNNATWLASIMSDLITCRDTGVRRQLKQVYQTHLDPMLMTEGVEDAANVSPAFRLRRSYENDTLASKDRASANK